MKQILAILVPAVVLAGLPAPAAARSAVELDEPCSGLEFRVDQNLRLATFEGTAISWKRLSSPDRGWRFGLSPMVSDVRRDGGPYSRERLRVYRCEVTAAPLFLSSLHERTRFYWGAGPVVGVEYEDHERVDELADGSENRIYYVEREWYLGIDALVGVEYFFAGRMSLMGEYGLAVHYGKAFSNRYTRSEGEYWRLETAGARLGLSVLF